MRDPSTEVTAFAAAAALLAAGRTGLLDAMEGAPPSHTPGDALGLDPTAVDLVLGLLASTGVVRRGPDGWSAPASRARIASVERTARLFDLTEAFLRTGRGLGGHGYEPRGVTGLAAMFEPALAALTATIAPIAGRVVDLGAGSAIWGLALARPDATVVAVDTSDVFAAARARAGDRALECVTGSLFDVDLAALRPDRVVLGNVLHLFGPERASLAVRRAAAALRPGGDVVIVDHVVEVPGHAAGSAAYALHLRLRHPEGTVHPAERVATWLREAGLRPEPPVALSTPPGLGAIRASSPGP